MHAVLPLLAALAPAVAPQPAPQPTPQSTPDFHPAWIAHDVTLHPDGQFPVATELLDLDADGAADLACASWPSLPRLALLFGDGTGGFDEPLVHELALGSRGLVAADLDGDGDPDLAASRTGKLFTGTAVEVWSNLGARVFAPAGAWSTGPGGAPVGLDAADLDADGDLDLAVALDLDIVSTNRVVRLLNDGGGSFSAPTTFSTPGTSFTVDAADLDADGDPDLVVGGEFQEISVLVSTGLGFASAGKHVMGAAESFDEWPTVLVRDVDGDGTLDVLASAIHSQTFASGTPTGLVGLRRGDGVGGFEALEPIPLLPDLEGAVDLELADLDDDGHDDLVAAIAWNDVLAVLPGNGAGGFGHAAARGVGHSPQGVHAADLDQDGDLDVAVVESDCLAVAALENQGDGTFPALAAYGLGAPSGSTSPSLAEDLDGDGDLDVLVGFALAFAGPTGLALARNQGDGTFAPAEITPTSAFPRAVAAGDLDGDGDVDVAYVDDAFPARLRWRENDGAGVFGPALTAPPQLACDLEEVLLADVDLDGDLDALVGGCLEEVHVVLWDAAARAFTTHLEHEVAPGGFTHALAVGDLDGDGLPDLVSPSGVLSFPEVSLGLGDGTFAEPFVQAGGSGVEAMVLADLDADGILDLATHNDSSFTLTVMPGRGDGTFAPPKNHPAAHDTALEIVAADVDGDLDVDLLTPNPNALDVGVWRNDGEGSLALPLRLGTGYRTFDVEPGDFDGDGVLDLLALVDASLGGGSSAAVALLRGLAGVAWEDLGRGLAGTHGVPELAGLGLLEAGTPLVLHLEGAVAGAPGAFVVGWSELSLPVLGGTLVPSLDVLLPLVTDGAGAATEVRTFPPGVPPGVPFWFQAWVLDPGAAQGFAASGALKATTP